MVEKISVQIALEGGAEVEQQLAAIGEAGNKAFAQVGQSGEAAAEGVEKAAESTSKLSLETVKTSAEIAELTSKIALHGVEIVQAVRHHDTLIQSLIKLASGLNTASRLVAAFTPELALVGVSVGSTAAAVLAGVVAFEAIEKVLTKFAASSEQVNNTLQTLAATTGQSFDKLQQGQAAFGQIGIAAETFRGTIATINETLATTDTKNLTRGMTDIVALVNQIAAGQKGITFADWVTAADKIKGVSIAMKQAADAGRDATQVLLEFIRNADLATAIKVGAAFGLSEADVDRVRRFGENINDLTQRIKGAGPLISPEAAAAFDHMRTSIQNVDSAWARFKQSLDSTVFTSLAANFSSIMNDMKAAALNGAAAISEALGRAFTGMAAGAGGDIAAIGAALRDLAQQTGALALFKQMQADAVDANAAVANFVGSVMQGMGASAASIQAVKDSINGITPAIQQAGQAAQTAGVMFTQWGTVAQQGANTAQAGVQQTATQFTIFGTVASQSAEQAKASMVQAAGGAQTLGTAIQGGSDRLAAFASQMAGIAWDSISSTGVAAWDALTGAIQSAIDKLLQFLQLKPSAPATGGSAPATGGSAPGAARGGLLGGRGTGMSDSNLAWVSRGEYITPARAVRQPGVLAFLEALRRSGGNLQRALDGVGRFALGGLVPRQMSIPALASGGLNGGMSNVTIQFPGLPAINGLRASSEVVEELHRAAALAQVRSGGRKPSRYS